RTPPVSSMGRYLSCYISCPRHAVPSRSRRISPASGSQPISKSKKNSVAATPNTPGLTIRLRRRRQPKPNADLTNRMLKKSRQRRSRIVQTLNIEGDFSDIGRTGGGFSVHQDPLQGRTVHTKCGLYLLGPSLAAALLDSLFGHPAAVLRAIQAFDAR